jgi:hypothetical protein
VKPITASDSQITSLQVHGFCILSEELGNLLNHREVGGQFVLSHKGKFYIVKAIAKQLKVEADPSGPAFFVCIPALTAFPI